MPLGDLHLLQDVRLTMHRVIAVGPVKSTFADTP